MQQKRTKFQLVSLEKDVELAKINLKKAEANTELNFSSEVRPNTTMIKLNNFNNYIRILGVEGAS